MPRLFRAPIPKIPTHSANDPQAEWEALCAAIERTRHQIQAARDAVARRAGASAAAILEAHLLCLDDSVLRDPARRAVLEERCNAAAAWQRAIEAMAANYSTLDDEYLRVRAGDVMEVGRQVLLTLPHPCDRLADSAGVTHFQAVLDPAHEGMDAPAGLPADLLERLQPKLAVPVIGEDGPSMITPRQDTGWQGPSHLWGSLLRSHPPLSRRQ